jgi:hypothetical protein
MAESRERAGGIDVDMAGCRLRVALVLEWPAGYIDVRASFGETPIVNKLLCSSGASQTPR